MTNLTKEQKEIILKLGSSSDFEMIPNDVWAELISLDLIYRRTDGNYDLSEKGEKTYKQLVSKQ